MSAASFLDKDRANGGPLGHDDAASAPRSTATESSVVQTEPDDVIDFGATPHAVLGRRSDDQNINGLLSERHWLPNDLTYSFPDDFDDDYGADYPFGDEHSVGFTQFDAAQQNSARRWFDDVAAVAALDFVELDGPVGSVTEDQEATFRFGVSDVPGANTAFAFFPNSDESAGDTWYGTGLGAPDVGRYVHTLIGHELGHALGLSHGHQDLDGYGAMLPERDSSEYSIMTYRSYIGGPETWTSRWDSFPQTLMMYDIAALQFSYGANYLHNAGHTRYSVDPATGRFFVNSLSNVDPAGDTVFRTVWDGGGVDTYDFANLTTDLTLDLRPGEWVDLDARDWAHGESFGNAMRADLGDGVVATGHIANALQYGASTASLIENGRGGSGNDEVIGNEVANVLHGNDGHDLMTGNGGADRLDGGSGNDILRSDSGQDVLTGGSDADRFVISDADLTGADIPAFVITDFEAAGAGAGDWIDFRSIDANVTQPGDQAFTFDGFLNTLSVENSESSTDSVIRFSVMEELDFGRPNVYLEGMGLIRDGEVDAGAYTVDDFLL